MTPVRTEPIKIVDNSGAVNFSGRREREGGEEEEKELLLPDKGKETTTILTKSACSARGDNPKSRGDVALLTLTYATFALRFFSSPSVTQRKGKKRKKKKKEKKIKRKKKSPMDQDGNTVTKETASCDLIRVLFPI